MGFLANIGIASEGYDASEARARAAQMQQLAIDQKQREAEEAQRKLEDERRAAAYLAEVRSVLPTYLAGGQNGIAAQDAQAVQQQATDEGLDAPGADEPTTSTTTVTTRTPAKPAQDNEFGMLEAVKNIAVKHGRIADYEAMKKRVKAFGDEGLLDFIKQARSGADEDTLMDTFNKSGNVKLSRLTKVGDGVYAGVTKAGKPVSFDVDEMTTAMLSPKDYTTHSDKEEATSARLEANQNTNAARVEAMKARLAADEALRSARVRATESLADQRDARAAGGQSARTSGNWNQFDGQVKSLALSYVTTPDPDNSGKNKIDRSAHLKLTSMAQTLARQDPSLSPGQAVETAAGKLDEIRSMEDDAQAEAEDMAAKSPSAFSDARQRKKWIETTAKTIVQRRSGASAPVAAPKTASAPAAGDIAKPASQAEFDALPPGTKFINPADGTVRIKK